MLQMCDILGANVEGEVCGAANQSEAPMGDEGQYHQRELIRAYQSRLPDCYPYLPDVSRMG